MIKASLLSKIKLETTLFEEDLKKRLALSAFRLLSRIQLVSWFVVVCIGGNGTLQKYRGTGTRYFAKISTAVPVKVLSN